MIVSRVDYRRFTDDYDSYDGDVDEALADAQAEAERITNRKFDHGDYTETLELYNGRLYPSAIPLSVASGSVVGMAIDLGYWFYDWASNWSNDWSHSYEGTPYNVRTVTYTGGWTEETAPLELKRDVARLAAARLIKPKVDLTGLPQGVTSISTLDMALSGKNLTQTGTVDSSILTSLYRWRRYEL